MQERIPGQQPQPETTLSRAVERTRDLYERNGWTFLPLDEPGQANVSRSNTADSELLHISPMRPVVLGGHLPPKLRHKAQAEDRPHNP